MVARVKASRTVPLMQDILSASLSDEGKKILRLQVQINNENICKFCNKKYMDEQDGCSVIHVHMHRLCAGIVSDEECERISTTDELYICPQC